MDGAERYLCVYVENSALMALVNFFIFYFFRQWAERPVLIVSNSVICSCVNARLHGVLHKYLQ